mmetsp:Transcript_123949/g.336605  ORF Transcript_123949/g.336605 Transcript_123949/m.336605 type:complete len:251 (+) Transcript_123949:32-784(+)
MEPIDGNLLQAIVALLLFCLGLPICCATKVWTWDRLGWLVHTVRARQCHDTAHGKQACEMKDEVQLTDIVFEYTDPDQGGHFRLRGISDPGVEAFAAYSGLVANLTLASVLAVVVLCAVQFQRIRSGRNGTCAVIGFWLTRVPLWISALLVQVLFLVQLACVFAFLILDCLCPPSPGQSSAIPYFDVETKDYCYSSRQRGGGRTVAHWGIWTVVGYTLVFVALVLMASSLTADYVWLRRTVRLAGADLLG